MPPESSFEKPPETLEGEPTSPLDAALDAYGAILKQSEAHPEDAELQKQRDEQRTALIAHANEMTQERAFDGEVSRVFGDAAAGADQIEARRKAVEEEGVEKARARAYNRPRRLTERNPDTTVDAMTHHLKRYANRQEEQETDRLKVRVIAMNRSLDSICDRLNALFDKLPQDSLLSYLRRENRILSDFNGRVAQLLESPRERIEEKYADAMKQGSMAELKELETLFRRSLDDLAALYHEADAMQ